MKANTELTISEFLASQNIKRAMLNIENPLVAKEFLLAALRELHT